MINKSEIFKKAWRIKRYSPLRTFGTCLRMAWKEAKELSQQTKNGIEFVDGMKIEACGYTRELARWTKGNMDRVYINGGSRNGDGYVDLKSKQPCLRGKLAYQVEMANIILSMVF